MELDEHDRALWLELDQDPPAPSSVDIERAMATGRRRRRIRAASAIAGAAALATVAILAVPAMLSGGNPTSLAKPNRVGASPTTAAPARLPVGPSPGPAGTPPTSCTLHRLPTPPGVTMAITSAIDPTGRYVVGRTYKFLGTDGIDEVPTIWHDGTLTPVILDGADPTLNDVNASGDAIGTTWLAGDEHVAAWFYHGSTATITRLAGTNAEARAINSAGVVVGKALGQPVVWTSPTAPPTPLSDQAGMATGIDDDGTIVGTLKEGRPVVWYPDGTMHPLPLPADVFGAWANGLDEGWAVGRGTSATRSLGLRWNVRTGTVTAFPAVDTASGATSAGWIIGHDGHGYGALVTDAATVRLPPLATPVKPLDNLPNAVSADGLRIAGQAVLGGADRTIVAVLWTCA